MVCHSSLLRKFHLQGVHEMWCTIRDWYDGASSQVKWKGALSDSCNLSQGVHQGRVTSTELYKCYVDPLLYCLEDKKYGARIGHYYVGAPTCADDTLLASHYVTEMQVIRSSSILSERKILSSSTKKCCHSSEIQAAFLLLEWICPRWSLNGEPVQFSSWQWERNGKHLGLERNNHSSNKAVIQDRILTGRRTTYMLSWELDYIG